MQLDHLRQLLDMLPVWRMLSATVNMGESDNKLLVSGVNSLRERLPAGWKVVLKAEHLRETEQLDGMVRITSPDRRQVSLATECKAVPTPRDLWFLLDRLRNYESKLVIAQYLSEGARERLTESGTNYIDLTGNARISLAKPGLFVSTSGADSNPVATRGTRTLRGAKAARIVRALIDRRAPRGIRDLAQFVDVDPGYVSRVIAVLDEEAVIERKGRGKIVSVDWERLLRRWARDAPFETRGDSHSVLDPRGVQHALAGFQLLDEPAGAQPSYAITGSIVANNAAPISATRLLTAYVRNVQRAIDTLGLRRVDVGANVILIEPDDDGVFSGSRLDGSTRRVAFSQAAADLLGSPGRGPAEGEALIAWMKTNEEMWRE